MKLISTLFITLFSLTLFSQSWEQSATLPLGRHHPVTWGFDSVGYVVTGTNAAGQFSSDFYRYSPATDQWSVLPSFPGASRSFAIGATYNGKGYLGFGASTIYHGDIWEYDPSTENWQLITNCPCEPRRHPAFVITDDGRLFVGLGDGPSGNLNDWWEYNIETDTWTQHPDLPGLERHHPFMFKAGDHVYAGLGHGDNNPGLTIFRDWYRFNTSSNQWETMNDFPSEGRVAGTQFDYDGYGYILSGDGDNHSYMPTGEFWKYDHTNDTWELLPPHPGISLWAPGSFVVGNELFFVAGQNRQQGVNLGDVWKYSFEPDGPPANVREQATESVSLYPNPAQDLLFIQSSFALVEARFFDAQGKVFTAGITANTIDVSALPNGFYVANLVYENGRSSVEKIVVRH